MREPRLGDIIDDYCVKCKRLMNHAVVSLVNGEPAKVRCRTCHNDHDYRHEQAPPPKVDTRKQALFNEVLAKVAPGGTPVPVAAAPFVEEDAVEILDADEGAEEAAAEEDVAQEAPPRREAWPAPKTQKPAAAAKSKPAVKPKAKGRK